MAQQLPLHFGFNPDQSFSAYVEGDNAVAVAALRGCAEGGGETFVYIWGPAGLGKTHLLNASCMAAHTAGRSTACLPLADVLRHGPGIFEGMEQLDVLCLDDVQAIAGKSAWEQALFHLYNRSRDAGRRLIVAADAPPTDLGIALPDLASRLAWGLTIALQPLDDESQLTALTRRANALGMELPPAVGHYLMSHCSREPAALWRLLDGLDRATLAAQRKLTLPFLKTYLENTR